MTARPLVRSLAAALLCAAAGVAVPAPASAASGYCDRGSGVTVVVDNGPLGGGTSIGCDPAGADTAGSTVVPRAGFPLSYVARQPGFVCRVAGQPDASRESCGNTPPADAYWGLFWSDGRSGTWTYASVGIGSLKVPAGGFIGWRFQGSGSRVDPGPDPVSPAPSPAPQPTSSAPQPTSGPTSGSGGGGGSASSSTPTRSRSTAPRPSSATSNRATSGGPTVRGTDAAQADPSASGSASKKVKPTKGAKPASGSASATPTPSDTASATAAAPESASPSASPGDPATGGDGDLAAGEQARSSSGPGLPLVAGGLLVALAGAAGTLAWRRRGV